MKKWKKAAPKSSNYDQRFALSRMERRSEKTSCFLAERSAVSC